MRTAIDFAARAIAPGATWCGRFADEFRLLNPLCHKAFQPFAAPQCIYKYRKCTKGAARSGGPASLRCRRSGVTRRALVVNRG